MRMDFNDAKGIVRILATDYHHYGGLVERWSDPDQEYPDCSCGCRFWHPLRGNLGEDWGVCLNPNGPRSGLLTWEHQAGHECYDDDELV